MWMICPPKAVKWKFYTFTDEIACFGFTSLKKKTVERERIFGYRAYETDHEMVIIEADSPRIHDVINKLSTCLSS